MDQKTSFVKRKPDFVGFIRTAGWIQSDGTIKIKISDSVTLKAVEITA